MAISDNYIDKITKDGESRMISPAADNVRVDNEHYEGDNLDEVLDEIDEKVSQAGTGNYTKPSTGIPKSDMESAVQTSLGKADSAVQGVQINGGLILPKVNNNVDIFMPTKTSQLQNDSGYITADDLPEGVECDTQMSSTSVKPVQNKVIKAYVDNLINGLIDGAPAALDTLKELATALGNNSDAIATIINTLSSKANASEVVKSISVNGTPQQKNEQGNVDINAGADVSVTTDGEGTIVIHVGDTAYPINLNHTHADMVKLVKFDESDQPATMDDNTIYVQVDDAVQPTEIEKLYLFGLEFAGGVPDTTPKLLLPRTGATIDFNNQSEVELTVKGKNLLSGIALTGTGDFDITDGNGNDVSTISATDANDGVTLVLVKGSGFDFYGGTIEIASGAISPEFETVEVSVVDSQLLPSGFSNNKAWNGDNEIGSGGTVFSAPGDAEGYVTTPFYQMNKNNNSFSIIVRSGFVMNTPGELAKGLHVTKQAADSANTNDAYNSSKVIRRVNSSNVANENYISATMKKSELNKCFILDEGTGTFFFKGKDVADEDMVLVNTAWMGEQNQTTPTEQNGYCTTPFFGLTVADGKTNAIIKAGFTCKYDENDTEYDIEKAQEVYRTNGSTKGTTSAWRHVSDPIVRNINQGNGTLISATFKMSELADCYIYDVNAAEYIWAGSNVDTSSAPIVQS